MDKYDSGSIDCVAPGCEATIKNHKFAKIKANESGWYFQKNNDAWCPIHDPGWVTKRA